MALGLSILADGNVCTVNGTLNFIECIMNILKYAGILRYEAVAYILRYRIS